MEKPRLVVTNADRAVSGPAFISKSLSAFARSDKPLGQDVCVVLTVRVNEEEKEGEADFGSAVGFSLQSMTSDGEKKLTRRGQRMQSPQHRR